MLENDDQRQSNEAKVIPSNFTDPAAAREQATEYMGITASKIITLPNGGTVEIPNPGLFSDEQQERWDELQLFVQEQCMRAPDTIVPDTVITTKDGSTSTIKGRTVPGDVLQPLRTKNSDGKVELVKPSFAVRQAIAVLGEEEYERFKAGGGRANDVSLHLAVMQKEFTERTRRDSKSAGSSVVMAAVPDGNRS